MFHALRILTASLLLCHSASVLVVAVFNPREYSINAVTCPAIDKVLNQTVDITIGEDIAAYMRTTSWISSRRVYRCQSFCEYNHFDGAWLAESVEQLGPANRILQGISYLPTQNRSLNLFQNDYRLVAIDVRGFGGSSHPSDIQLSSTMADITGDLMCVLEHAEVPSAICLGYALPSVRQLL
ncbi:hypothetical protein OG21DRAFT_1489960 [Imleria badia]|nr:hypothetical protein OG21DRAFT_1489960 [Imleria badia]